MYAELIPDDEDAKKVCCLKILIPASAIGSIMGKSGEAVHKLELSTGTKITISALKDLYPGTKDRVCLISGNLNSVSQVNRIIMDKMFSNPDICCRGNYNTQKDRFYRPRQVKLIIPQCTASKVIGKGGSTIEKMKVGSGSFIQLSRKAFPVMLRERCVTVNGEPRNNDIACRMILKIIADETTADYYKNVSYCEAVFPLPNAFMSGPPIAKAKYTMNLEALPESSINRRDLMLFLDQLKKSLDCLGYPEDTVNQTAECILTLSNHRVMDICLSLMINYFYPRAHAVYERNKGIVSLRKAPPDDPPEKEKEPPNAPSSMFIPGDLSLGTCPRPIPATRPIPACMTVPAPIPNPPPMQSHFGHGFASAAPAFPASSGASAAESYHRIQKSVAAPAPAFLSRPKDVSEEAFSFWRSAYALPPFQSNPDGFNCGKSLQEWPSTTALTRYAPPEIFTPGNTVAAADFNAGRSSEAKRPNHLAPSYIEYSRALGNNIVQKR